MLEFSGCLCKNSPKRIDGVAEVSGKADGTFNNLHLQDCVTQTLSTRAEGLGRHLVSAAFWNSGALSSQVTLRRTGAFFATENVAWLQYVSGGGFGQET